MNKIIKTTKTILSQKKKINYLDNKFKKKQRVFLYKKNCSIYEAMNLGLKKSKYNSVIFLNSGDIFYKKCFIFE